MPANCDTRTQQGRQHLQGCGQNIGQHGLVLPLGQRGLAGLQANLIGLRIQSGGCERSFINVDGIDPAGAILGRTDRQDA